MTQEERTASAKKAGKARWEGIPAEDRSEVAKKAVRARWGKKKEPARMPAQPFLSLDYGVWVPIKDGNPTGLSLFLRHYSAKQKRKIAQFVGPGEKMVLLTPDARALFVWRKFISDDIDRVTGKRQIGVNCAVFRNEESEFGTASDLIRAAIDLAWERWPTERLYTYVDPSKVRAKKDPGHCFIRAGFRVCGMTKKGLLILELFPAAGVRSKAS